jgi:hypothetical protein
MYMCVVVSSVIEINRGRHASKYHDILMIRRSIVTTEDQNRRQRAEEGQKLKTSYYIVHLAGIRSS